MLHASAAFPSHWVLILDAAIVLAGLALAASGSPVLARVGRAVHHALFVMARRPALALVSIALASALYLGVHTMLSGPPLPSAVDEWSYLVAADTFAHNRLANPPHPMAAHFDGPHVLQSPTYASKYPPAQGFMLAVGQVALGHPARGLWLEAALLVLAVGWMLLGWVPRQWAIFGALLVALRLGAGGYWNESYWGGSVAAIGGALLIGATRRLWRRVRVRDAALLAIGIALLANSRPYEGFLLALPVAALLLAGLLTRRLRPAPWLRLVLPVVLLLAASLGVVTQVNRAITGDPLVFPHQLYTRDQGLQPLFLWQPSEEETSPDQTSPASSSTREPTESKGWRAPRTSGWHRLAVTLYFFLGLPGALAVLTTPASIRDGWSRFAAVAFLAVAIGHFLIYPWWAHYSAPALGALVVVGMQGHRLLYTARRGDRRAFGPALFATACVAQLAVFLFQIPSQRADATDPSRQRARLAWEFEHRAGKHLLLVSYPPGWSGDWTFNRADVDAAKVVWATDLGAGRNDDLMRYFSDRTVWAIDARFEATDPMPQLLHPARGE